jgi:hypothetical protein
MLSVLRDDRSPTLGMDSRLGQTSILKSSRVVTFCKLAMHSRFGQSFIARPLRERFCRPGIENIDRENLQVSNIQEN